MVVLAETNTTSTSTTSNTTTAAGEGFEGGDEGTHKERGHSGWQVVPIDWQGVPIEEVN